ALAFAPDHQTVAAVVYPGYIRVWDVATGKIARDSSATGYGSSIAFLDGGKTLLTVRQEQIYLWDAGTFKPVRPLAGHRNGVNFLQFAADGRRVLTGEAERAVDSESLLVWDRCNGRLLGPLFETWHGYVRAVSGDLKLVFEDGK